MPSPSWPSPQPVPLVSPTLTFATTAGITSSSIRPVFVFSSPGKTAFWSSTKDSGKLVGGVTGIHGAHGTASATSSEDRSIVTLDRKTFKIDKRIAAEDADGILHDKASDCLFSLNGNSATVIDAGGGNLVTSLPLR